MALQVFEAHWPGGQQHKKTLKILDRVCRSPLSSSFSLIVLIFLFLFGSVLFPVSQAKYRVRMNYNSNWAVKIPICILFLEISFHDGLFKIILGSK